MSQVVAQWVVMFLLIGVIGVLITDVMNHMRRNARIKRRLNQKW